MADIFCCKSVQPYKARRLDHQAKFDAFLDWASVQAPASDKSMSELSPPFAIQLVRQVNFGPLESKRYFVPSAGEAGPFLEITEDDLIKANFKKLNTFKNCRCTAHNKFFEVNVYQKDPTNKHHWRADLDRPASSIDL